MPEQSDSRDIKHVERINAELKASLKTCRAIIRTCRERLAANSNDAETAKDQDGDDRTEGQ